jgi:hypothetical protein
LPKAQNGRLEFGTPPAAKWERTVSRVIRRWAVARVVPTTRDRKSLSLIRASCRPIEDVIIVSNMEDNGSKISGLELICPDRIEVHRRQITIP